MYQPHDSVLLQVLPGPVLHPLTGFIKIGLIVFLLSCRQTDTQTKLKTIIHSTDVMMNGWIRNSVGQTNQTEEECVQLDFRSQPEEFCSKDLPHCDLTLASLYYHSQSSPSDKTASVSALLKLRNSLFSVPMCPMFNISVNHIFPLIQFSQLPCFWIKSFGTKY